MYTVKLAPTRKKTFESRRAAIRAAREASNRRSSAIKVLRDDGWERLVYRDGSLERGTFVTRDRRRRVDPLT